MIDHVAEIEIVVGDAAEVVIVDDEVVVAVHVIANHPGHAVVTVVGVTERRMVSYCL